MFSYDRAEGFVTFDTTMTSPEEFLAELDRMTDFSGTVRADADSNATSHEEADEHPSGSGNGGTR